MGSVIHTVYPDGRPASCHLSVSDHMAVHHMWLSLLDILYHWLANFSCIRITWSLVKTRAAGPVPRGSDSEGLIQMRPETCISDRDACWGWYCWPRDSDQKVWFRWGLECASLTAMLAEAGTAVLRLALLVQGPHFESCRPVFYASWLDHVGPLRSLIHLCPMHCLWQGHARWMCDAEWDNWNEIPLWPQTSPWILTVSFQSQRAPQRVLAGIPQIQLGPTVGLIGSHRI